MRKDTNGDFQTSLDFIHDILVKELELTDDRIIEYDESVKLPKDEGLFITIQYNGSARVIGNRNIPLPALSSMAEDQEVNMQEQIVVSVCSRNREAMYRKEEVMGALRSIYAQQVQEAESFKIFTNSHIDDLSAQEGAAMLRRYDITVVAFTWYSKTKIVDYYDTFSAELTTDTVGETDIPIPLTH